MRALLLAAVLAAGCGRIGFDPEGNVSEDNGGGPPLFEDGTRLRAIRAVTDGAEVFAQWRDTEVGVDCSFVTAVDGRTRCLPVGEAVLGYWADAACTQPVAYTRPPVGAPGCETVRFARDVLDDQYTMWEVTGEWSAGIYFLAGGTSGCGSVARDPERRYYTVGLQIAPDTFVAASETIVPHGRLSHVELEGNDGSRQRARDLIDTSTGERCRWIELEPGIAHCAPWDIKGTFDEVFVDPACTVPAIYPIASTTRPVTAYVQSKTLCSNDTRIYELVGPPLTTFYALVNTSCIARDAPIDIPAYARGAARSLDAFSTATFEPSTTGTGRVRPSWFVTSDDMRSPEGLWDTALDQRCGAVLDPATSTYRCTPRFDVSTVDVFADAACTVVAGTVRGTCRGPGARYVSTQQADCDARVLDGFAYDVPVAGWVLDATVSCVPVDPALALGQSTTPFDASPYGRVEYAGRD